jgi:hypothetical protein
MIFHFRLSLTLLAISLSGCAHDMGSMMSDYVQDLGRHMDALRIEDSTHASEISVAATSQEVQDAEARHWQHTDDHLSRMSLVVGDMTSCANGGGTSFDTAGFARAMQNVRAECDNHRSTMRSASDLAADRAEEVRHHEEMGTRMDGMQTQWDVMMRKGASYACSQCRFCSM